MKKLVATAPRVAALVEYEDRAILANEVKIRVRFGAPKHGTEVVDFRAASPFIDEDLTANGRCSPCVRQMRRAVLSLANSSLATWCWRHYRVRQRRYRLRGGRQRMRLRPTLRDGHH